MGRLSIEEAIEIGIMKPRHLIDSWDEISRRIRQGRRIVLLSDFDGTLVRIHRSPEEVQLSPPVQNLLAAISRRGLTVGIVSGRSLGDLRARVGVKRIWYVGTHGLSVRPPSGPTRFLATPEQKKAVARARRELSRQLNGSEGIYLEPKDAALAVHYRNAPWRSRLHALGVVRAVARSLPGLRLLKGKQVWELLPDSQDGKWGGVQHILRQAPAKRRLVFYLGDDASDEEVFEHLRGITVAVGKRRQTCAHYFLSSAAEVRHFLNKVLEAVT